MPTVAEVFEQAVRLHRAGDLSGAQGLYEQLIAAEPGHAAANQLAGALALQTGQPEKAVRYLRHAITLNPSAADAFFHLGVAERALGEAAAATAALREAVRLNPNWPDALNNLGLILKEQGLLGEAAACFRQALTLAPRHGVVAYNLGNALMDGGQLDEAITHFRTAIEINPRHVGAHNNLANALMELGRRDEAAECYETVLRLEPEHPPTRWNRARLHLLQGKLPHAWADYEYRWKKADCPQAHLDKPRWDGFALAGKTILLHCEQGLGDSIQFVRYAPLIKQRGGIVLLECPPILADILKTAKGIERVVLTGDTLPSFAVQAPLLSLPGIFGTNLESIPADVPYLSADPKAVEKWRSQMANVHGLKVGIAWQGNPRHPGDRYRSVPLNEFEKLAGIDGVSLFSLQLGPGAEQIMDVKSDGLRIADLGREFDPASLADLAGALANLDLVIAVDTAVAHLAGALGLPVWTLLPVNPDWRWLLQRADSPWYPTMRLYRQTRFGDWSGVIQAIRQDLGKQVEASRGRSV